MGIRAKLLGSFGLILVILAIVGGLGYYNTVRFTGDLLSMYNDRLVPVRQLATVTRGLYELRLGGAGQQYHTGDAKKRADVRASDEKWMAEIDKSMRAYSATQLTPEEAKHVASWQQSYPAFLQARAEIMKVLDEGRGPEADQVRATRANPMLQQSMTTVADLIVIQDQIGAATYQSATEAGSRSIMILLSALIVGILFGIGVAWSISRGIALSVRDVAASVRAIATRDLPALAAVARALASGDLTRSASMEATPIAVTSGDEIGAMAQDFNRMIDQLNEVETAFGAMGAYLRDSISEVQQAAERLASTSGQLGSAADQAGNAVGQIAASMQRLSSDAQIQAETTRIAGRSVGQLMQATDQVARGSQDQARAIADATDAIEAMAADVELVARSSQDVADASEASRASADEGAIAVRSAVTRMTEIEQVVSQAAARIDDLGKLGEKIGVVVGTIDDIAAQTNLLALNAAIEAARAGEHGRGFAIVADEVRKLAERSQRETRAVADLIHAVQRATQEAVKAIQTGAGKAAEGSAQAGQAGEAIEQVLTAMHTIVSQVGQVAAGAQKLAQRGSAVSATMVTISAAVEQSTASTEEMAASSTTVNDAVDQIVAVSESSSTATEEIAASTEEMSAQVEELTAQASELANTAEMLRDLTARFDLGQAATAQPVRAVPTNRRTEVRRAS